MVFNPQPKPVRVEKEDITSKICKDCREEKSVDLFWRGSGKGGLSPRCKACEAEKRANKQKKCKNCGNLFPLRNSLDKYCSPKCASKLEKKIKNRGGSNEFSPNTRSLFNGNDGKTRCFETGVLNLVSLHHIMGRSPRSNKIYSSPLNAIPLSDTTYHSDLWRSERGEPAITSEQVRERYLNLTVVHLYNIEYKLTQLDIKFIEKFSKYYSPQVLETLLTNMK